MHENPNSKENLYVAHLIDYGNLNRSRDAQFDFRKS